MVDATIQTQVLQIFGEFSPSQQQQALELLLALRTSPEELQRGSGAALLRHAGRISEEDGRLMEKVIEDTCERIDPRDWQIPS